MEQRLRPKKLPCGHILHFGCLRSWLERQQVCPTCRRSVLSGQPTTNNPSGAQQQGRPGGQPAHAQGQAPGQAEGGQHPRNNHGANIQNIQNQNPNLPAQWRRRTFNLGPVRFEIGMGQMPVNAPNMLQGGQANPANLLEFQPQPTINLRAAPQSQRWDVRDPASIYLELFNIERNIAREIAELNVMQQQLGAVRALQAELARLRILQSQVHMTYQAQVNQSVQDQTALAAGHNTAEAGPSSTAPADAGVQSTLPPGMTLPEGWALLPLTRTEAPPQAFPALPLGFAPPQTNLAGLSATQVAQMQAAQAQAAQAHAQMLASQTQAAQPMLGNASVGGNGQPATNGQSGLPGVNGQREVSESTNGQPPQMVRVTSLFPPTGVPGVPTVAQQNAYQHGATTSGPSASANSSATPTGEASTTSGDQDTTSTILPASVPTWSFGDNVNGSQEQQPETSTMTTDSHAVEGESSELPNANGSAEGHVDKGKARAATVEDAQDDE